jgi:hypothetical protein
VFQAINNLGKEVRSRSGKALNSILRTLNFNLYLMQQEAIGELSGFLVFVYFKTPLPRVTLPFSPLCHF